MNTKKLNHVLTTLQWRDSIFFPLAALRNMTCRAKKNSGYSSGTLIRPVQNTTAVNKRQYSKER